MQVRLTVMALRCQLDSARAGPLSRALVKQSGNAQRVASPLPPSAILEDHCTQSSHHRGLIRSAVRADGSLFSNRQSTTKGERERDWLYVTGTHGTYIYILS